MRDRRDIAGNTRRQARSRSFARKERRSVTLLSSHLENLGVQSYSSRKEISTEEEKEAPTHTPVSRSGKAPFRTFVYID
ncbi:hypothetical protein PUN28_006648 [Cardiocondyla obscurior]|uniref:Uncharacterized protein n=1 Tax=Cardiocondyla obscurior TaxID=286306 RepID=A0AAW2GEN4_9HYME